MNIEHHTSEPPLTERFKATLFNLDQARAKFEQRNFGAALGYLVDIERAEAYIRHLQRTDFDYNDTALSAEISRWWRLEGGEKRWEELRAEKAQKERDGVKRILLH